MTTAARTRYTGHRFPPEIISRAAWLYFRFPLSLRRVEDMLAARGILSAASRWKAPHGGMPKIHIARAHGTPYTRFSRVTATGSSVKPKPARREECL